MTNEWISVYPEGYDLKTPERKELYKFILSRLKDAFGDAPKKFTQALKILFFEGKVETCSSSIVDKKELMGRRPNDLGGRPYVFICLASPVVSLEFYKSVLKHYEEKSFEGGISGVFGRRGGQYDWSDDLILRFSVLLQALDEAESKEGSVPVDGRIPLSVLYFFFKEIFFQLNKNGSSRLAFGTVLVERFSQRLPAVRVDELWVGKYRELTAKEISSLLNGSSGRPEAYEDDWFVGFVSRYFSRDFNPDFLQFMDELYESIPEAKRIGWDGQRITNYPGNAQ